MQTPEKEKIEDSLILSPLFTIVENWKWKGKKIWDGYFFMPTFRMPNIPAWHMYIVRVVALYEWVLELFC